MGNQTRDKWYDRTICAQTRIVGSFVRSIRRVYLQYSMGENRANINANELKWFLNRNELPDGASHFYGFCGACFWRIPQ